MYRCHQEDILGAVDHPLTLDYTWNNVICHHLTWIHDYMSSFHSMIVSMSMLEVITINSNTNKISF